VIITFIRNHTGIFSILTFLFLLFTFFSLNYSGMCVSEFRWLSEKEQIRQVVEEINSMNHAVILIPEDSNNKVLVERVPYVNADEFLEENSNCCQVR